MALNHSYPAPDTATSGTGDESPSGSGNGSGSGSVADFANRAADAIRQQADVLAERVRPQIDAVANYARDEPAKALLIATATGAGLMALLALATRSSSPRRSVEKSAAVVADKAGSIDKSDIVDVLRDLVARIPGTANSAVKAASDAADAGKDRASSLASTVVDTVTDTLKNWRDQASPVVDRVRPQIDAATAYAKDEPVKVALGVAVTGAILAGLIAALRSDD